MAQKSKAAEVAVRLLCILSGDGVSWSAGQVVQVAPAEAERLIGMGAAEAVK